MSQYAILYVLLYYSRLQHIIIYIYIYIYYIILWVVVCRPSRPSSSPDRRCAPASRRGGGAQPPLYHTILYYTILYDTILYYTINYYTIPYKIVLQYIMISQDILYYDMHVRSLHGSNVLHVLVVGVLEGPQLGRVPVRGIPQYIIRGYSTVCYDIVVKGVLPYV